MKMKNNYLLIQEINQEEITTPSGLIIPPPKHNRKARIIETGSDQVKPGNIILKNMGKGTAVTLNNTEFEVIHINQIFAIIEENA
jgi:co-chaperonin GroES (HSP10)|tara:strand:+ start:5219 stop:5473 length:255 start_codon:yes stop_codon:yes gene_type:complete